MASQFLPNTLVSFPKPYIRSLLTQPSVVYVPAWFPGAGFHRWARNARELFFRMTRTPFNQVKAEMVLHEIRPMTVTKHRTPQAEGSAKSSFVSFTLTSLGDDRTEEDQEILMSTAGSLFSGMLLVIHYTDCDK